MRVFIYPSDIQILTGRTIRYAQIVYNQILDSYGKTKDKGLTIKDYCLFHGLDVDEINTILKIK
jgi:hypothetical protein